MRQAFIIAHESCFVLIDNQARLIRSPSGATFLHASRCFPHLNATRQIGECGWRNCRMHEMGLRVRVNFEGRAVHGCPYHRRPTILRRRTPPTSRSSNGSDSSNNGPSVSHYTTRKTIHQHQPLREPVLWGYGGQCRSNTLALIH